ncbi:hypothetical protein Leryth_016075 [Lithospermum erythrorhizon]|nr:hypothetical protein Leryth_016075 [Lithospermum erythrorhizon]
MKNIKVRVVHASQMEIKMHERPLYYVHLMYPKIDISIATTVAEGTIKNAYRDLYPHV